MYFKHRYANLFYEKIGHANRTIVILPGWGNTRHTFQFLINQLKQQFSIYIFDYPGFGNSPPVHKELKMEDYATLIRDFLYENHIENPIIISHSFGGRITSILLGRFQYKADKVVLMDVAGIKRNKISNWIKASFYKFFKKIFLLMNNPSLMQKIRSYFSSDDYLHVPPYMYKTFKNIIQEDLRSDYSLIDSEVLIIWGKEDLDTPVKDAYYLHKHIKNSGLVLFPKVSHFSYLEEPFLTLKILKCFFNQKDMND